MSANKDFGNIINEFAERIKSQVDIVSHISKYESLTEQGSVWQGPHSKHDSENEKCFTVWPEKNSYYCFHCDEGGDIITFEANRLECTNFEAMKSLADDYGVEQPDYSFYRNMSDEEKEEFDKQTEEYEQIKQILQDYCNLCNSKLNIVIDYIKERGITEDFANLIRLGYGDIDVTKSMLRKYSKKQLAKSGLFTNDGKQILKNRLIIPTLDRYGNPCHFIGRNVEDSKTSKYLSQRSNQDQNYQAVERSFWKYGEFNSKLDDNKTYKSILIVEGSIDAILAAQSYSDKFIVLTANTTKLSKRQIEQFCDVLVDVGHRNVYICNDNDNNGAGLTGAVKTIEKINRKLEDLIVDEDGTKEEQKEQYKELYRHTNSFFITVLRKSPHLEKIDLADLINSGREGEALYWIESSVTFEQYNQKLTNDPDRFYEVGSRGGKGNLIHKRVVDEIFTDGNFFLWHNEKLFWYRTNGLYTTCENEVEVLIKNKLGDNVTAELVSKIHNLLKISSKDERITVPIETTENSKLLVNTKSGWVDFAKDPLSHDPIPHSPYKVSFQQLNVNYDKTKQAPLYNKFMNEVLGDDDQSEWIKMLGYTLVRTLKYQRAFMLTGRGGCGKSTAIEVIQILLGEDNYSLRTLKDIENDPYALADLSEKFANFYTDLPPGYIPSSGVFKPLSDGAKQTAREIYGKPFDFYPECTLIFSANEIPRTNDTSEGYYDRWIFFAFDNRFRKTDKEDPDLVDKLTTPDELSGIFNLAWLGFHNLQIDKGFKQTERGEEIMEELKEDDDIIIAFTNEAVIFSKENTDLLSKQELYDRFKDYVDIKGSGREKISSIRFNRRLKQIFPDISEKQDTNNNNRRSWVGLQLKDSFVADIELYNDSDDVGL